MGVVYIFFRFGYVVILIKLMFINPFMMEADII